MAALAHIRGYMRKLFTTPAALFIHRAKEHIRSAHIHGVLLGLAAITLGVAFPGTLHTKELAHAQVLTNRLLAYKEVIRPPAALKISEQEYIFQTIRQGNTIGKIAQSYGTTPETILTLNNLSSEDALMVGKKLKVPSWGAITISWYGSWFNGRQMANAEPYHTNKLVIAHRYLPLGTCVKLTNPESNESVIAVVKDRIADRYAHRWDVSPRVFRDELGFNLGQGLASVGYEVVECGTRPSPLAFTL